MQKVTLFFFILFSKTLFSQYAGDLDLSFNSNGIVVNPLGFYATSMVLQPDGKILLAAGSLFRYHNNGTLDNSFDLDGSVSPPCGASSVALQNDGKIVVAGQYDNGNNYDVRVLRYNSDGTLDNTFGTMGLITIDVFSFQDDTPSGIAVLSDGRIIVCGSIGSGGGFLLKLNTDGSMDNSFNSSGTVLLSRVSSGMKIQSDGKIVIVGTKKSSSPQNDQMSIQRINSDGTMDNSFDSFEGDGIIDIGSGEKASGHGVAIQPDGKIIAVGSTYAWNSFPPYYALKIERLKPNGDYDFSKVIAFSNNPSFVVGNDVALQSDGKIVIVGYYTEMGISYFGLARLNSDGTFDNTFSSDGLQTTLIENNCRAYSVLIQPDGKILVGGTSSSTGNYGLAIARYLSTPGVSVEGKENWVSFKVYPNPLKDETTLSFQTNEKVELSIFVTDLQGRVVKNISENMTYLQGNNQISFDTKDFANGVYFLQIKSEKINQYCKLIK